MPDGQAPRLGRGLSRFDSCQLDQRVQVTMDAYAPRTREVWDRDPGTRLNGNEPSGKALVWGTRDAVFDSPIPDPFGDVVLVSQRASEVRVRRFDSCSPSHSVMLCW